MKHHGLVPERRTNKNGVTTTRWVKPAKPPKESRSAIPVVKVSPSGTYQKVNTERIDRIRKTILPTNQFIDRRQAMLDNIKHLDETVPDLLDRIVEACEDGGAQREKWMMLFEEVDYSRAEEAAPGINRVGVERALTVFPFIEKLYGDSMDESSYMPIPAYMDHYYDLTTFLTSESGRDEASENETKAMVLVGFIRGIKPNMSWEQAGMDGLYSEVKDDVEFLSSHFDEVEPFIPELMQRGTHDREYIENLLNSESRSLSSGIL